jgi:tetratricopeptide (TPR) repeat protein
MLGRETDIIQINRLLTDVDAPGHSAVVAIVGPPGVGKTSLAREVACFHEDRGRWSAVAWLGLGGGRGRDDLERILCEAVDIAPGEPAGRAGRLLNRLRERPVFLVLDELEALLSRKDAERDLQALLQLIQEIAGPARFLLTSRRRDLLPFGSIYVLRGLSRRAAREVFHRCAAVAAISATPRASADFTDESLDNVSGYFAGNPLGIRLIAGLAGATGGVPHVILRDLQRYSGTRSKAQTDRPRIRSAEIWEALEEAFRALPEGARFLFLAMSIFEGGADAAAIEAVVGTDRPGWQWDEMAELRARCLVEERWTGEWTTRWSLHPYLLEFARQRLGDLEQPLMERSARHFLELAQERGAAGDDASLERESPNLTSAALWCGRTGAHDLAIRFGLTLRPFLSRGGEFGPGLRLFESALDSARATGDKQAEIVFLHEAGRLCVRSGRIRQGRGFFAQNLANSAEPGGEQERAVTLHMLGNCAFYEGDLAVARQFYLDALSITESTQDGSETAANLVALGNVALDDGHTQEAEELFRRGLRFAEQASGPAHVAAAKKGLGVVAFRRRRWNEALELYTHCLDLERGQGDKQGECHTECLVGRLKVRMQGPTAGLAHYSRALNLGQTLGDARNECIAVRGLAMIHLEMGDAARSRALLERAMQLAKEGGFAEIAADIRLRRARVALASHQYGEARALCEEGIAMSVGRRPLLAWGHALLGEALAGVGEHTRAAEAHQQARRLAEELGLITPNEAEPTESDLRP